MTRSHMKAKIPTAIAVDVWGSLDGSPRLCVNCLMGDAKYHYWCAMDLTPESKLGFTTIFKNPGDDRPSAFSTKHLRSDKGEGRIVFEAMSAAAPGLLQAAIDAKRAAEQSDQEKVSADLSLARSQSAGPQLVVELRAVLNAVKAGPPQVVGYGEQRQPAFDHGWKSAMDTVYAALANARSLLDEVDGQGGDTASTKAQG